MRNRTHTSGLNEKLLVNIALTALCMIAVVLLLQWCHPLFGIHETDAPALSLLKAELLNEVRPENLERFTFAILSICTPFIAWRLSRPGQGISNAFHTPAIPVKAARAALPSVAALTFLYPFFDSAFVEALTGLYQDYERTWLIPPMMIAALIVSATAVLYSHHTQIHGVSRQARPLRRPQRNRFPRYFLFAAAVLTILAYRLFGIERVSLDQSWFISFDAAIYALGQVTLGRTLLADLPSQYGLFPEFLAPILRITGLSIFTVSATFALMQFVSLAALFLVLERTVKNRTLLVIFGLALITLTGASGHFAGSEEVYLQYWPIRFFWPALSVWMFLRFLSSKTLARGAQLSLVSALGLLWNLDTGLAISIAYSGYLFFRGLGATKESLNHSDPKRGAWRKKDYFLAASLHVAIVLLIVCAFFMMLTIKSGEALNFQHLTAYQEVFYRVGFGMLPMPSAPHAWVSIVGVYVAGLLYAFNAWHTCQSRIRSDIVGFLAFLGIALFAYYQGRSHELNLLTVSWPALLIAAILSDEMIRAVRQNLAPNPYLAIPIVAGMLGLLAACSWLYRAPQILQETRTNWAYLHEFRNPIVKEEIEFIKRQSSTGNACLILSKRQGIYHIEAGIASPLGGPGLIETLTKLDHQRLVDIVLDGKSDCLFLGLGARSQGVPGELIEDIFTRYRVVEMSSSKTMMFLSSMPATRNQD